MSILNRININSKVILIVIIMGLSISAFNVFYGKTGLVSQWELKAENQKKQAAIDSLKSVLKIKHKELQLLKNDSNYLEYLARVKLGMSRPEEKTFQFIDDSKLR